jgi:hypothetical protein
MGSFWSVPSLEVLCHRRLKRKRLSLYQTQSLSWLRKTPDMPSMGHHIQNNLGEGVQWVEKHFISKLLQNINFFLILIFFYVAIMGVQRYYCIWLHWITHTHTHTHTFDRTLDEHPPDAKNSIWLRTKHTDIHAAGQIRTSNPIKRSAGRPMH